jgi:hypothetical protein
VGIYSLDGGSANTNERMPLDPIPNADNPRRRDLVRDTLRRQP